MPLSQQCCTCLLMPIAAPAQVAGWLHVILPGASSRATIICRQQPLHAKGLTKPAMREDSAHTSCVTCSWGCTSTNVLVLQPMLVKAVFSVSSSTKGIRRQALVVQG